MSPEAHRAIQALLTELRYWMCDEAAVEYMFSRRAWADGPGWAEINLFNLSEAVCGAAWERP